MVNAGGHPFAGYKLSVCLVAALNDQQLADVVQKAGQEHLGCQRCATQAQGQLSGHDCGAGRVISDPSRDATQVLKHRHRRHRHGQASNVRCADTHDGLRDRSARILALVGGRICYPQNPRGQREIQLDQLANFYQLKVRTRNAVDQASHDRRKGAHPLSACKARDQAACNTKIGFTRSCSVEPKIRDFRDASRNLYRNFQGSYPSAHPARKFSRHMDNRGANLGKNQSSDFAKRGAIPVQAGKANRQATISERTLPKLISVDRSWYGKPWLLTSSWMSSRPTCARGSFP